jgi:hypothetical protein
VPTKPRTWAVFHALPVPHAPGGPRQAGRLSYELRWLPCQEQTSAFGLKADTDEDGVGGDDAADTLRYLLAIKPRELVVRKLVGLGGLTNAIHERPF